MKHRSQLCSIYQSFTRMIHTQFSTPIKVFRSDSGGEYLSDAFRQFLTSQGTLAQLSCPGAHAQNAHRDRSNASHFLFCSHSFLGRSCFYCGISHK